MDRLPLVTDLNGCGSGLPSFEIFRRNVFWRYPVICLGNWVIKKIVKSVGFLLSVSKKLNVNLSVCFLFS
jgi:hypothetical protein